MHPITRRTFLKGGAVSLLGIGMVAPHAATENAMNAFSFAVLNDPHIKDAASAGLLDETIAHINADAGIQFTVAAGDLATDGNEEELQLARLSLDRLTAPWRALPGNHDVRLRSADIFGNYRNVFGDTHWTQALGSWTLIGFNSCEGVKSDVVVADEELAWLKAQADTIAPDQPVALFCHHPLNPTSKAYRIKNAEDILALFKQRRLKLAAAGHFHGNQEEKRGNVLFTTSACCADSRGNHDNTTAKGYRVFHVTDGELRTEFRVVRS